MIMERMTKLLLAPPATGRRALVIATLLVIIPTVIRLVIGLWLDRLPFFAYIPFVVLGAVMLHWRWAAGVALASWLVADMLFMGPAFRPSFGAFEVIGFVIFMCSAMLVIALVEAARMIIENSLRPARTGGFHAPVVFSLEGGQAWASWYGSHSWVRLGPEADVAEMMEDFLAQRELGKRLARTMPTELGEEAEATMEKMAPRA